MVELRPPQWAAQLERGLLDQAKAAVVGDPPTSSGKTLLAQFQMLQALNQFDAARGWVAGVAPARALLARVARGLRRDFDAIKVGDKQLTAAVDGAALEDELPQARVCSRRLAIAPINGVAAGRRILLRSHSPQEPCFGKANRGLTATTVGTGHVVTTQ